MQEKGTSLPSLATFLVEIGTGKSYLGGQNGRSRYTHCARQAKVHVHVSTTTYEYAHLQTFPYVSRQIWQLAVPDIVPLVLAHSVDTY